MGGVDKTVVVSPADAGKITVALLPFKAEVVVSPLVEPGTLLLVSPEALEAALGHRAMEWWAGVGSGAAVKISNVGAC